MEKFIPESGKENEWYSNLSSELRKNYPVGRVKEFHPFTEQGYLVGPVGLEPTTNISELYSGRYRVVEER